MKNIKSKYTWHLELQAFIKENENAIIGIIIAILFIIYFIIRTESNRTRQVRRLKCQTDCELISIKANEAFDHDFDGTEVIVPTYTAIFKYEVYGKVYTSQNLIPNSTSNKELIVMLCNYPKGNYRVRYDCNNPQRSLIMQN